MKCLFDKDAECRIMPEVWDECLVCQLVKLRKTFVELFGR